MSRVVVVAGATGFAGSHVIAALEAAGHTVRCGTRHPDSPDGHQRAHGMFLGPTRDIRGPAEGRQGESQGRTFGRAGPERAESDRDRARVSEPGRGWVHLDVEDATSLQTALAGADSLIYLVHQMHGHGDDLLAAERASAGRVRDAAEAAGLRRIVYLGGP